MDNKYTSIYKGELPPRRTDVLWIHHSKRGDLTSPVVAQTYSKGKWVDAYDSEDQSEIKQLQQDVQELFNMVEPVVVDDITGLTSEECDALSIGSVVEKDTGTEKHTYIVTYKDETKGELLLTYADWQNVEGVYYDKTGGDWAYVQTDNTHISEGGGNVQSDWDESDAEDPAYIKNKPVLEPLVIEGDYTGETALEFHPSPNQPSFEQAKNAFLQGRTVVFRLPLPFIGTTDVRVVTYGRGITGFLGEALISMFLTYSIEWTLETQE